MAKGEASNCFRLDSGLTCVGQQLNNVEQCRIKTKARQINSPTTPSFAGRINPNHSTVPPFVNIYFLRGRLTRFVCPVQILLLCRRPAMKFCFVSHANGGEHRPSTVGYLFYLKSYLIPCHWLTRNGRM